jgi:dinuclear metal center YbgI/SA1388 family protein
MHPNASLDDIAAFLDDLLEAPKYAANEPDANGLIFRAGPGVTKVAVAVNTSITAIVGAARAGAQLLVVHHPPWLDNDHHLRDEKLAALEAAGISLYAAHASLDCAPKFGNGWVLAEMLGVRVDGTFGEFNGGHAGVIGAANGSYGDFLASASRALGVQVEAYQHADTFGRVAIVTGSGGNTAEMDEARRLGADTYVTGEGKIFTRLFAKEAQLNLVFGTHQATEAPGIRALGQRVSDEAQIPWEFIAESPDVF